MDKNFSFHISEYKKGDYKTFDKIIEEYEEILDARKQNNKIMEIIELSDLIGAIEGYIENEFNLTLNDLILFSNKVKESKLYELNKEGIENEIK